MMMMMMTTTMMTVIPNSLPDFHLAQGGPSDVGGVRRTEVQQGFFHAGVCKGGDRDKGSGTWGGGVAGVMVNLHGRSCWVS